MRSIQVNIDKPNFMINPTNCSPFSVASQGIGDQGTVANFSSSFQAVNCVALPFKPQDDDHASSAAARRPPRGKDPQPAVRPQRPGPATPTSNRCRSPSQAPSRSTSATSATSAREPNSTRTKCAGRQPIGTVTDETPLLEEPLSGPGLRGLGLRRPAAGSPSSSTAR